MLLTQGNTTRGVALESVTHMREPFRLTSTSPLAPGERTRIILFAYNLAGADIASLAVDAEDDLRRHYDFKVEFVAPLPGAELAGVSYVVVKLNDNLGEVGDVLIQLLYKGVRSNRVRVGIGFVGGGLPDDVSRLSGRVLNNIGAVPMNGVMVTLTGPISGTTFTDVNGNYEFTNLVQQNSYTVSVAKQNYRFSPPSETINSLIGNPTANFTGIRLDYTISGKITEGSSPIPNLPVSLSGSQEGTTTTDANGNYSFTVPAEGNYTVTPASNFYSFNTASVVIFNLSSNHVFNFNAVARATYTLSGHIYKSGTGTPLGGATVTLSGAQTGTATTDAAGYYVFYNVTVGGNYTLTPSKTNYGFSPSSHTFTNLAANQTKDFTATLVSSNFEIRGRVMDSSTPLQGVTITWSGSQSGSTTTDANGNYSFRVASEGDYTIVPSTSGFIFSPPGYTILNLSNNHVLDFKTASLFHVLEFDGSPLSVDYGEFFVLQPGQTQLGKFFWEFWAMPGDNAYARYLLSDGYGGAHALLFGFVGDSRGTRYSLYGNVWNGSTAIDFGSDDGPAPSEWGHVAVGWDGSFIYTYFNGVPVGLKPFSGPRMPAGTENGGGRLYIGGSDHSNFDGHIEQVRGFENINPRDNGLQTLVFRPDNLFGLTPGTSSAPRSTFLTNFLRPSLTIPDLAGGRAGVLRAGWPAASPVSAYPLPQFVVDTAAPNASAVTGPVAPTGKIDPPALVPNHAIIFDSFSRKTSTYAFNSKGGLGSTEGGTAGIKAWKTSGPGGSALGNGNDPTLNETFGIVNGRAVALSDSTYGCLAWVETGSTTGYLFTSVSKDPGPYKSGIDTGIAFRVLDPSNFFFAFTYGDKLNASPRKLIVGYWLNSAINYLALDVPMPASWTNLQVLTTSAGAIQVFADSTVVYATNSGILANATGTGLFSYTGEFALANRWDNFTVFNQP